MKDLAYVSCLVLILLVVISIFILDIFSYFIEFCTGFWTFLFRQSGRWWGTSFSKWPLRGWTRLGVALSTKKALATRISLSLLLLTTTWYWILLLLPIVICECLFNKEPLMIPYSELVWNSVFVSTTPNVFYCVHHPPIWHVHLQEYMQHKQSHLRTGAFLFTCATHQKQFGIQNNLPK